MKLGIGIDTGGTCTDAVIYRFEDGQILACAKTNTTKEDLSVGIREALAGLPRHLSEAAQVIALSTTLATNACVEGKGGRGKLIFFGVRPDNVRRSGAEYGLVMDDTLLFIDSKTRPDGQIVRQPDWADFEERIACELADCEAVGVVEMFAKKSGAPMEKRAREIIQKHFDIPVVCGHQLFAENNIVKRGASVLLNARLISIITGFTAAVKQALSELSLDVPFVIVRSDGTMMNEAFAREHPIETLLCGPVASVMGAMTLTDRQDAVIIDIGGTTTDIAFVKDGSPRTSENGVRIGGFDTFVKGLFVDTFGLGGDSGVLMDAERNLRLSGEKVMPVCMAASAYPSLKETLSELAKSRSLGITAKEGIYLGLRDIGERCSYSAEEKKIAQIFYHHPMTLAEAGRQLGSSIYGRQIERLVREGILIRCGLTPTDAMHIRGDFSRFDREASVLAAQRYAQIRGESVEALCTEIYSAVEKKLYCNIVRILLQDAHPAWTEDVPEALILDAYERAKAEEGEDFSKDFFDVRFAAKAPLIGVGAPTHVFLPAVAKLLRTEVLTPDYAPAANALGAIVGNVSARVVVEVQLNQTDGSYTVFGRGQRYIRTDLEEAKALAKTLAEKLAREEAARRGAGGQIHVKTEEHEDIVQTDFGPLFMGYRAAAVAAGEIGL